MRMHRLVCAFVVRNPRKTGFLAPRPSFFNNVISLSGILIEYQDVEDENVDCGHF